MTVSFYFDLLLFSFAVGSNPGLAGRGACVLEHRILYKDAIIFGTADRRAFRFLCVLAGALSTRHACRAMVALDLYTRNNCFSQSVGSWFGGPGQKALPAMNEFTLCGFLPNPFIHNKRI